MVGVLLCDVLQCDVVLYGPDGTLEYTLVRLFKLGMLVGWIGIGWNDLDVSYGWRFPWTRREQCIAGA